MSAELRCGALRRATEAVRNDGNQALGELGGRQGDKIWRRQVKDRMLLSRLYSTVERVSV